jgi:hypothetical protein
MVTFPPVKNVDTKKRTTIIVVLSKAKTLTKLMMRGGGKVLVCDLVAT